MGRFSKSVVVLVLLMLLTWVSGLRAHWAEDGVGVCTDASNQSGPVIARDGMGGAFIAWIDQRNGNYDIYAQRVNVSGTPLWTADGVPVCTDPSVATDPQICADGDGGAIVTWKDYRNGNYDIFAQRIGPNGTTRWTADGIAVCTDANDQYYPYVVGDGLGGAMVVWEDWRNGNIDVYAQRIDAGGYVWWTYNGVPVCSATNNQSWIRPVSDGAGGAVVCWMDYRNSSTDIYAQRIDGSGTTLWTAGGDSICTQTSPQGNPAITGDGSGGAIISWQDQRNGGYPQQDIYAQRINSSGSVQWTVDGIPIGAGSNEQFYTYLDSDGSGGAVIVWLDNQAGDGQYQVYAQRVDSSGTALWTTNGVKLSSQPVFQTDARIVSDGSGAAIASWNDNGNIRVQRVDASGTAMWGSSGILLCGAAGSQGNSRLVSNDAGGCIVSWNDNRNTNSDIYACNIDSGGQLFHPAPEIASVDDVPADQGGQVYLSWMASRDESFHGDWVTHYTVWRAMDPLTAVLMINEGKRVVVAGEGIEAGLPKGSLRIERLGGSTYYWQLMETQNLYYQDTYGLPIATLYDSTGAGMGYHYFQVVAQTSDPMVYWASLPDSGYSVDNLSPCTPLGLAGEQSYVPEGLTITWEPNQESDLDGYAIYRGVSDDFVPGPGNRIASPCDTMYFDNEWRWDSGYYYKIAAVDIHGNESGYVLLQPDDVTGDETPDVPSATYLAQNFPNPFNPSTSITFGIKATGHVRLFIYDAAGRLVRVLVDGERKADVYHETWDGMTGRGKPAASGIYFYRLATGDFVQTRKMVLLR
jgi:hypothetical protein